MWLRMRQIALIARELAPVVDEIREVFGLEVAYRDPEVAAFGLENAVFPVGNQFLEVVAPVREGTAGGRYLDRRGGDGGDMGGPPGGDPAPRPNPAGGGGGLHAVGGGRGRHCRTPALPRATGR